MLLGDIKSIFIKGSPHTWEIKMDCDRLMSDIVLDSATSQFFLDISTQSKQKSNDEIKEMTGREKPKNEVTMQSDGISDHY